VSSTLIVIITLVLYQFLLLGIGAWASGQVRSEGDYFIASKGRGGGLGAWTAGLSYAASTSSAWVLLGYTGFVFSAGVRALWLVPGIFGGYLLTWLVMGPKLNTETAQKHHITMVDFMIADADTPWRARIAALAAALILFCFVFYVAAQFQAAGNAFSSVFGWSTLLAVSIGATIIVAYCLMGGFLAASLTDAVQAVVILLACIIVPWATLSAAGGLGAVADLLHQHEAPTYFQFSGSAVGLAATGMALGLLGTGLGAPGQPQLINRVMAARDKKARLQGAAITVGWGAITYLGVTTLAFSARALMPDIPSEQIFFIAADTFLPPVMAGLVLAAILSAVMSTVDSLLLAAGSAISHDLGLAKRLPGHELLVGRLAMVGVALFSLLLTVFLPASIFDRVLFSWVALGAAFGPVTLSRCIGWRVQGAYVFFAILLGFIIAALASNFDGPMADLIEKWLSWGVGFALLYVGRGKSTA